MRFPLRSAASAAFLFAALHGSGAQDARPAPPQIVTSGQGEARVAPDRASISIGVQTRAVTAAGAASENSRKQRLVIDAIRAKGIPQDLIGTSAFSLQPETQVDRTGQNAPRITGYLVSNVVTVEVRKTDLVGPVIDAALGAGANQVHSLSYSIANPDSARRAALAEAVGRAKADAEVVARAAGGSLGPLIELTTSELEMPRPMYGMLNLTAVRAGAEVPVEPGMEAVRASVTVRWQYLAGPPR